MLVATDDQEAAVKNDPDEQKRAEEARHVDLPHRTGATTHEDEFRPDEPRGDEFAAGSDDTDDTDDGAVGMKDRDIPQQEGDGWSPPRPTAEGVDRRGARPDRS